MTTTTAPIPDAEHLRRLLRDVVDPEVGVNIVDLGLVYRLEATPARVDVEMTMTSPACPMGEMILDEVRTTLAAALPPDCEIDVRLVWEPPWTPAMMSERAKRTLGWDDGADPA